MSKLHVAISVACVLAACSSQPTREDVARDVARADAVRAKAEQARAEVRQKQATAELADVPGWILDVPKPDDRGVYAVGSARSDDVNVVLKKAMVDGQFGLAKQVQQEVSGTESSVRNEQNGRRGSEVYRSAVTTLVSRVPIVAIEVLRNEVKVLPTGQYAAYVLLLLPNEQLNRALAQQRGDSSEMSTQVALDDLERRIRERQQSRALEADSAQRARLAELSQRSALVNAGVQATVLSPASSASSPDSR